MSWSSTIANASPRLNRLFAARHLSEQAEVFRPVMTWPQTGHGRGDATTDVPDALGAARSDLFRKEVLGQRVHRPSLILAVKILIWG
jgi:hypothetical protein